jgi:RimJ/RimL family protein N-acetyltransferase
VGGSGRESSSQMQVRGEGLTLREWADPDVPCMVRMFNTSEIDRWTPLAHPFDETVAAAYVERARDARAAGTLQLAITEDGQQPLGEVLLSPTDVADTCEFAYAVGAAHRGRNLAARAIRALLPLAKTEGYRWARLRIATDNLASQRVATAAGFAIGNEPLLRRERKGYVLDMATWICPIS